MEVFAALMMLGVRVREVSDLIECAIWCSDSRLLLIDRDLSWCERELVADQMLSEAGAGEVLT